MGKPRPLDGYEWEPGDRIVQEGGLTVVTRNRWGVKKQWIRFPGGSVIAVGGC